MTRSGHPPSSENSHLQSSRAVGCVDLGNYRFALVLNPNDQRSRKLVACVAAVVRNARSDIVDLTRFHDLFAHSLDAECQFALEDVGELVTVGMSVTTQ